MIGGWDFIRVIATVVLESWISHRETPNTQASGFVVNITAFVYGASEWLPWLSKP